MNLPHSVVTRGYLSNCMHAFFDLSLKKKKPHSGGFSCKSYSSYFAEITNGTTNLPSSVSYTSS
jgi:hypothetical protein